MTERLIIDSSVIAIPIAIRDKNNPDKLHDHTLKFDMSDEALKDAKKRQVKTSQQLDQIRSEYGALFDDADVTEDNLSEVIAGMDKALQVQFDADFGDGEYEKVSRLGGGNSIVNLLDLYMQVNDFIGAKLDAKFNKINQKSANRKAKYMKKYNRK